MASINNKVFVIIADILALIGWIVALGGVAKINDVCNDYVDHVNEYENDRGNSGKPHRECSDDLRWQWWGIWFCFFLTIIVLIVTVLGKAAAWTSTLQIFCAVCVGVTMLCAHMTYFAQWHSDASQAALAGFVIASIALFLLIILLGMEPAGVNVSIGFSANKTSPDPADKSEKRSDKVEKISQQPKGADNA